MVSTDKDKQVVVITDGPYMVWLDKDEWEAENAAKKSDPEMHSIVLKKCTDYFDENGSSNLSKGEIKERRENGDYTRHKPITGKQDQFREEQWRLKKKRAKLKRKRKRR